MKRVVFAVVSFFLLFSFDIWSSAEWSCNKIDYKYSLEPIDVVIPTAAKDYEMLELCVRRIRENVKNVRRVIVVSSEKAIDSAEWFDETLFPFSKPEIAKALLKNESLDFENDLPYGLKYRMKWYLQQLLKFYAPFVIPDISENVLIVDSDVVFINPTEFQAKNGVPRFGISNEYHLPYFGQMSRLLPGLRRVYPHYSGIAHVMLFQRCVLEDLFSLVEGTHNEPFWKAWCHCVALEDVGGAGGSEYEIYFNFILDRVITPPIIHAFKWGDARFHVESDLDHCKGEGYNYVSCHHYLRY